MAKEDKLELAIKHNTKVVEAAEKERIQALKNQILSAEMADAENLNAIDKLMKSNEKFLTKTGKIDKRIGEESLKVMEENMKEIKDLEKLQKENDKVIADANLQFQETSVKNANRLEIEGIERLISLNEERFKLQGKSRKDEIQMFKLEKKKFQLELKQASPSERAEMLKDQAAKDSQMLTTLQAIGQRIRGNEVKKDKGDSMFTGPLKFLKGILIKGALLAFLMFLPKILDSKFMRDAIDFIQDKVIPGIKSFYENAIKPLGRFFIDDLLPIFMKIGAFLFDEVLPIIEVYIVAQIEALKNLFKDLGAAFDKIMSGDILGGITDMILGIGKFVIDAIDNLVTGVFNIIAKIFGFEGTDSVFGSIAGFFTGIYDTVVEFVSNAYNSLVELVTNSMIFKFFQETIGDIIDSIKAIFSGEDIIKNLGKLAGAFLDIVMYPYNLAINFFKDIFGFGDPDEPFRLSEFIGGIFTKIGDFFRNLLDIDIRALASKFLPKTAVDFLLGKDEEEAKQLEIAENSGLFTKRGALRDSKIDRDLVKYASEGQLQAILADDDLADEDKKFIENEMKKRKLQKDLRKGGLGVASEIDDFGGTDRAIREASAREAASTNIVAPDQRVVSNSSTTVVQQETITPTYNGYNLVTTEPDY